MGAAEEVIEWDDEAFERALSRAAKGVIQARGVRLHGEQLRRLLDAVPRHPDRPDSAHLKSVDFQGTDFQGVVNFDDATFSCNANFAGACLGIDANFSGATFSGNADFGGATFGPYREHAMDYGTAFAGATFKGNANFVGAIFNGHTLFSGTTFSGYAAFARATVGVERYDNASFTAATFSGNANFASATFQPFTTFSRATFSANANFAEATFNGEADFTETRFEGAGKIGPIIVNDRLRFDGAVFTQRVRIEASASRASFEGAEFSCGAHVRLRCAEVWLENIDFLDRSLLALLPARLPREGNKEQAFVDWKMPAGDGKSTRVSDEPPAEFRPRVLSLRGSSLASLTLSGADLKSCRFAGSHGLNYLGLERGEFSWPHEGWRFAWPLWWTRRQTIAEEHHWHAREGHPGGWDQTPLPTGFADSWPPQPASTLEPDQIADVYRQLRKGREDSKDEPGASDFYYGEMEMRRRSGPKAERAILSVYWLVSGYGLRASRALLALAITIAVLGAIPLALWSFRPHLHYRPDSIRLLFANGRVAGRTGGEPFPEGSRLLRWARKQARRPLAGSP